VPVEQDPRAAVVHTADPDVVRGDRNARGVHEGSEIDGRQAQTSVGPVPQPSKTSCCWSAGSFESREKVEVLPFQCMKAAVMRR
jgi:hypothetical protein